jgi:hypothetical protein
MFTPLLLNQNSTETAGEQHRPCLNPGETEYSQVPEIRREVSKDWLTKPLLYALICCNFANCITGKFFIIHPIYRMFNRNCLQTTKLGYPVRDPAN